MNQNVWNTIIVLLLILSVRIFAQLSPGDLSRPHAHLENLANCQKCHAVEKQIDADKCLKCHNLLSERIKSGKGLHARPKYGRCQSCHAEHNGRDFQLIWWPDGIKNFDHSQTGYELKGKHEQLECRQCHRAEHIADSQRYLKNNKDLARTFLGLSQNCLSCHADQHGGQFAQSCEECHSTSKWKPVEKFNHDKTRFPLTGSHRNVACSQCHGTDKNKIVRFRSIQFDECTDCHRDPHQARLGKKCGTCHTTVSWRGQAKSGFDHDRTLYPLRGKHRLVTCRQCHPKNRPLKSASFAQCTDCHRDYHRGAFIKHSSHGECAACHTVDGFTPSTFGIAEHQQSDYILEGAHLAVPCDACHRHGTGPPRFSFQNRDCQVCHKNPHGQEAEKAIQGADSRGCAFCHGFASWQSVTFTHDRTDFPLEGKHLATRCSACHKKTEKGELHFSGLKSSCQSCHSDIHAGQFMQDGNVDCSKCHVPNDWLAEKFNHNHDSRFTLEGAHRFVGCNQCHPLIQEKGSTFRRYKPLEVTCASCHAPKESVKEKS